MSNPVLARLDDQGDRFYSFGDPVERFWSITTIIGGGIPKYLGPHYAKMAAELAYAEVLSHGPTSRAQAIVRRWAKAGRADVLERQARGELTSLKLAAPGAPRRIKSELVDEDLALRWLKGAADRHRDAAAARGQDVHDQAEALVLDHATESIRLTLENKDVAPWPETLTGYETSFTDWIRDWQPVFLNTEATVINRTQGFAGTLDTTVVLRAGDIQEAARRDGGARVLVDHHRDDPVTTVVDYKSGRALYAEVALQLAALARGEFVAHPLGRIELPMPVIEAGAALHLTPKGYSFRLVRIDEHVFNAFLYAAQVYRFRKEMAATVFLADLKPAPAPEAVAV